MLLLASRLVLVRGSTYVTSTLASLHWLPVHFRVLFKIVLFIFKSLNDLAPPYLSELIRPNTPSWRLRSADQTLLEVPRTKRSQVLDCITDHPGLNAVWPDPYGLQVAWMTYKQQYKGKAFDGPQDDNRVVLPACAVSCIGALFPPPGEEESAVFKGFPSPLCTISVHSL
uniref:Uncharacterized protein n=1 Tax=Hippocampus comes TaxID=109280 RepID=A0A3Q3D4C8_HIPCM